MPYHKSRPPLSQEQRQKRRDAQLKRIATPHLSKIIEQNIQCIEEIREEFERSKKVQDHISDAITRFSGSMAFVYLHIIWFAGWIIINMGWAGIKPFDPFPFGLLTMIVSLEAIFLSTFVLITQNRMSLVLDQRADLDLQINFLAEHEITRMLMLVDRIAKRLNIPEAEDQEFSDLEEEVNPEKLADLLKKHNKTNLP